MAALAAETLALARAPLDLDEERPIVGTRYVRVRPQALGFNWTDEP